MGEMDTTKSSHKYFHSFCIRPNTRFQSQGDNEVVIAMFRAHPLTLLFPFLNGFVFVILLFIANFYFVVYLNLKEILFINFFALVLIFNYFWYNFINWFFNVGIVTNDQVVDVDFNVTLYKEVSYTQLSHVEDVTAKSGGYFATLFNFGNLFIQTAGTEINTEFLNIPFPSEAAKIINQLVEQTHNHG